MVTMGKKVFIESICVLVGIILTMSFAASAVTILDNQSFLYNSGSYWDDYVNENGSHTLILHTGQVNYWNGTGYEPINTSIINGLNNQSYVTGSYDIYWNGSKKLIYKKNETSFTFFRGNITYPDSKKIYTLDVPQRKISYDQCKGSQPE